MPRKSKKSEKEQVDAAKTKLRKAVRNTAKWLDRVATICTKKNTKISPNEKEKVMAYLEYSIEKYAKKMEGATDTKEEFDF